MNTMYSSYYLVAIPVYKLIRNSYYLFRTQRLIIAYEYWLTCETNTDEICQKKHLFKNLISKAGVNDKFIPIAQPMGFGQIATFKSSVSTQFPTNSIAFADATLKMLFEAKGIFKERIIETFNPIYWIELFLFLPKNLLTYLGLHPSNLIIKILQLFWAVIAGIYSLVLALYPEFYRTLLENFLKILP